LDIPHLILVEKECQLVLVVDGKIGCMFQVVEAFDLDLVAVAEVKKERLFLAQLFDCGENLSFFLTAIDMDEFKPIVGGV
jgi:hypothetical protein